MDGSIGMLLDMTGSHSISYLEFLDSMFFFQYSVMVGVEGCSTRSHAKFDSAVEDAGVLDVRFSKYTYDRHGRLVSVIALNLCNRPRMRSPLWLEIIFLI